MQTLAHFHKECNLHHVGIFALVWVLALESRRKGSDAPSLFGSLSSQRKDEVQHVSPAGWRPEEHLATKTSIPLYSTWMTTRMGGVQPVVPRGNPIYLQEIE